MKFRALSCLLLASLFPAVPTSSAQPVRHGEHLSYRVSWAIVPGAGEIKIDAQQPAGSPERLVVTTTTATRGLAKMLMAFQARADSTFDVRSGRLLTLHEKANTRGKETEHKVGFDYVKREATYAPVTPAGAARALPMPPGDPTDLITALLQTRTWTLTPGEKRDALVLFDDDFYELTLHALRYEDVRTSLGTFKTLVLEPRMEKTPPKGMFRKGGTVHVWISQDERRLPVKFQVEFKIGTGTAILERYTPPAGSAAPAQDSSFSAPSSVAPENAKDSRP